VFQHILIPDDDISLLQIFFGRFFPHLCGMEIARVLEVHRK
jgi:hypothetical protein